MKQAHTPSDALERRSFCIPQAEFVQTQPDYGALENPVEGIFIQSQMSFSKHLNEHFTSSTRYNTNYFGGDSQKMLNSSSRVPTSSRVDCSMRNLLGKKNFCQEKNTKTFERKQVRYSVPELKAIINQCDEEHQILAQRYRKLKIENQNLKKNQNTSLYGDSRKKDLLVQGLKDLKASDHVLRQKTATIVRRMR